MATARSSEYGGAGQAENAQRTHLPAAYRLEGEDRSAVARTLPRCLFIEVTNRCNLTCATCPHTFGATEAVHTLEWEEFLRIVAQFPDIERAVLHGIGEPLLNHDLPRMIAHLKQRQVYVLFNTNATLLDERWAHDLIGSGLDELRVSLDSADPDTYARVRGAAALARVTGNLQRFVAMQRNRHADTPRPSIWMMAMRENIGELPAMVRLAARVGVAEVYVQRLVYFLDSAAAPGLMSSEHAAYGGGDEAERAIAAAEAEARRLGVALRAAGATSPRQSLAASSSPMPWAECRRPWTTAYVTANGNCLPCCISPFSSQDYASLVMGNLLERDFAAIWNNDRYRAWRDALLSAAPAPACRGCGVHWSL